MQDNMIVFPEPPPGDTARLVTQTLPVSLTSLIGREYEVKALRALLLRPDVRLLTLTGTAGVGKTRLALEVARDLVHDFADGVHFVSLAPISDPAFVISTIAHSIGLTESGSQPLLELLKTSQHDKQRLLLLDNFEQVITAAPLLSELLEACPQVKLLVTSREVLRLRAEHQFSVPPLALPDPKRLPDDRSLTHVPSVNLFIQRAQAIKSDFHLTTDNATSIAEICLRLDGLPLAIELAAARVTLFPPQALLARLNQRLRILTSGKRDVPVRQQTLRNTITWSYNLLDAAEQQLFRCLSVFVGSCILEAAEAVCGAFGNASVSEALSVLDGVASLIDKSLVQQTMQEGERSHLVMLETIREYALEVLAASGEGESIRQAHAMYYLRLAEKAAPELFGIEGQEWFARLEQEHENLRIALHWLLERKEAEQALLLCTALSEFWYVQGYWSEGRSLLEQALTASGEVATSVRAAALTGLGGLLLLQWDREQAERRLEESLALYRDLGDSGNLGKPLHFLGLVALDQGAYARARLLLEESSTRFREAGDKLGCAFVLCNLAGLFYHARGEFSTARSCAEESLTLFSELQDNFGISHALLALAEVLFVSQNDTAAVDALLEECRTHLSESGVHEMWLAGANHLAARVALRQGDVDKARSIVKECLAFYRVKGHQQAMADALVILGRVATAEGDNAAAQACYEESLAIARAIGYKPVIPANLEGLAAVVAAQGAFAWAARLWGAAEKLRENIGNLISPVERVGYEQVVATTRTQLEERAFVATWAEGRTMTPEQALTALKRASLPEPVPTAKQPSSRTSPNDLTVREMAVLRLLAQGLTSAQIAEQLVIGLVTVNSHVRSIYNKLGVTSRAAATRYALEHQLL